MQFSWIINGFIEKNFKFDNFFEIYLKVSYSQNLIFTLNIDLKTSLPYSREQKHVSIIDIPCY